ncbi:chorismate-binding protein [Actinoplanes sp. NPDC049265]|uniref:chorismate-binding protein n=1 Tax=Actinoplanes sp. NPDC049265 TaxID=3363902 RepID=UPI003710F049
MVHGRGAADHFPTPPSCLIPASPGSCQGGHRLSSAFRWSLGDAGDPAELVADFLTANGLPVRNIGRTVTQVHPTGDGTLCGAALYVSAAAGCVMAGGAVGSPTPAPSLPDVYAAVLLHGSSRPQPPVPAQRRPFRLGDWRESWTAEDHAGAVEAARRAIARGDIYQVNVVGHASAGYAGDPIPALARLAGLSGARYGGVLAGDGWAIGCASPETLVEVRGGRVVTRPIKGTRPATGRGRRELLESAKERAEHIMIVDLERNDLARLPGAGPVRVDELFAVREWSGLWQAESVVSAPLADGVDLATLLRAVCPGGSVTGAPKLAALDEIARLEPVGRGASMGALGWIGPDHLDLGLTIRTAAADGQRLHVWAGGGITWDSDPGAEVAEAAAKSAPVRATLAGAAVPGNDRIGLRS